MVSYKVLLFDFDGTLCDSQEQSLRIINTLADEFKYKKINSEELRDFKNKPLRDVLKQMKIPMVRVPAIVYRARNKFHDEIDSLEPIPGILNTLSHLKDSGFELGIVTSNDQKNVEKFLNRHRIRSFNFIRGNSSVFGKAKVLKSALKELRVRENEAIYIGDETRDIEAARSAKMKVISVTWGYNSREILVKSKHS